MNRTGHLVLGGIVGAGGYLLLCKRFEQQPTLAGFAVSTLGGTALGILADVLEPALHPNHRSFFHSATLIAGVGTGLMKMWENPEISPESKILLTVLGCAYVSHPLADALTPKGIPLF